MKRRGRDNTKRSERDRKRGTERLVRALVAGCRSQAQVLELYYWSKEPGLIEVIRSFVAMPEATRATLEAFVSIAHDPKSVMAALDRSGTLTLTTLEAKRTVALVQHVEQDDEPRTRVLN